MSFKGYLRTIEEKTGKGPEGFVTLAEAKGFLAPDVKATPIVDWLKADFGLGQGHAMAIVRIIKAAREHPDSWQDDVAGWA